jgi:hypothetical protein
MLFGPTHRRRLCGSRWSMSTDARLVRDKRAQVQILSPRLFFKSSPSARTSKGFLFVVTRFRSPSWRFKQTEFKISRRLAVFEPRHVSAAVCVQSKSDSANSPRAGSTSPRMAQDSSTLACWALEIVRLALVDRLVHCARKVGVQEAVTGILSSFAGGTFFMREHR